jgi:predicted site-specific integrase-resolvase
MKAVIYARLSAADGRPEVQNQIVKLRRFAITQGLQIVGE